MPVFCSPAVTKGKSPAILSKLFKRFPRVDSPNKYERLNPAQYRLSVTPRSAVLFFGGGGVL